MFYALLSNSSNKFFNILTTSSGYTELEYLVKPAISANNMVQLSYVSENDY